MFQTKILWLPSITEIIQQDATYMLCAVSQTKNNNSIYHVISFKKNPLESSA